MNRNDILRAIAARILQVERPHPVRVAIDGVTASGKTTLAGELAAVLAGPRPVLRASIDDFHNPPEVRYQRGRLSPEGYYLDTFDYPSVRTLLLEPLGPGGSRRYRAGSFGQPDGSAADFEERRAEDDAILIMDGVFLFRPGLNACWDYRIFIDVEQRTAIARGLQRDASRMGGIEVARERYEKRYVPGERLYLAAVRPWELADVVVVNQDLKHPDIRFRS